MRVFLSLLLLTFSSILFPSFSFAQIKIDNKQPIVLPRTTIVNHDYFAANKMVEISGTINGDVYAAGGAVLIDGTVNGDVLVAGGQVTIRGTVLHNIRSIGGNILVDGLVGGNVTAVGGTVTVTSAARIAGSLTGAGGQYAVLGSVGTTANIVAGQATIGTAIGSNLWIASEQITLLPAARINGDFSYVSKNAVILQQGAIVTGKTTHTLPPQPEQKKELQNKNTSSAAGFLARFAVITMVVKLLFEFIIGLLILQFVPIYSKRTLEIVTKKPWLSFGIGLLFLASAPIIGIILLITLIGIPLILVEIFIVILCMFIGKILSVTAITHYLLQKVNKKIGLVFALFIGLVAYSLLMLIPILGWIIGCVVGIIGFGAVLLVKNQYYREFREKNLI